MPRFFSSGEGWMTQVPIIPEKIKLNETLENLITKEIFRLIAEERMNDSFLSRVMTITVKHFDFDHSSFLTLRFNTTNHQPLQFAFKIGSDGKDMTLIRAKGQDRMAMNV